MKSKPEVFPEANISHVIKKLQSFAAKYKSFDEYLIDLHRKMDKNGNGTIEFEELIIGLRELGFNLSYQEAYTVMRYFDKDENWKLSLKELHEGLGGAKE